MLAEATNIWGVLGIIAGGAGSIASLIIGAVVTKRLGKPNGKGNVVEMNERQLILLGKLEGKLDAHIADGSLHHGDMRAEAPFRSPDPVAGH